MNVNGGRIARWLGVACLVVLNTVLMFGNGRSLFVASILWAALVFVLIALRTKWVYRIVLRRLERHVKVDRSE